MVNQTIGLLIYWSPILLVDQKRYPTIIKAIPSVINLNILYYCVLYIRYFNNKQFKQCIILQLPLHDSCFSGKYYLPLANQLGGRPENNQLKIADNNVKGIV